MKWFLVFLLTATAVVRGQTLQWEVPIPADLPTTNANINITPDGAGGCAVTFDVVDGISNPKTLFWVDPLRRVFTASLPSGLGDAKAFNVARSKVCLIFVSSSGTAFTFRTYKRQSGKVSFVDIGPLENIDFSGIPPSVDRRGFFLVKLENGKAVTLQRYRY